MGKLILTREVLASIPAMVRDEGLSRDEIAERLGVTVGTLQVRCSIYGISLRRKERRRRCVVDQSPPLAADQSPPIAADQSPPPCAGLSLPVETPLTLSPQALAILRRHALAKGCSEAKLASELLELIARDDLVEAVLDEAA